MRRGVVTVMVVVVVASGVVACGEDRDDGRRSASTAAAAAANAASTTPAPEPADTSAPAEAFPANGETTKVVALDNNFMPQTLTISAGTEVVFSNNGRNDHDVIPVGDLETVSWGVQAQAFAPKATYSHVFGRPGTYVYYCTIHGTPTAGMVATIVVTEP